MIKLGNYLAYYYNHDWSNDRLQDKLPILDFYCAWSKDWYYESRRQGIKAVYTGKARKSFTLEICLFRRAFVLSLEKSKQICPVMAQQLAKAQRKARNESIQE